MDIRDYRRECGKIGYTVHIKKHDHFALCEYEKHGLRIPRHEVTMDTHPLLAGLREQLAGQVKYKDNKVII